MKLILIALIIPRIFSDDRSLCGFPQPWSVSKISPQFLVITRSTTTSFRISSTQEIGRKVNELENGGHIAPNRQVVFIVPGFMDTGQFDWQNQMARNILNAEDSSIFSLNWSGGSAISSYPQASANAQTVATVISALAETLLQSRTFNGDKSKLYLYCIGVSLGAHVCGQAGRLSGRFDRVTGLDPAGPGFQTCGPDKRISTASAACVDNIHTDGSSKGHRLSFPLGTLSAWGHVDFYPNGGENQPGCAFGAGLVCSHAKATYYFIYTISNEGSCVASKDCNRQSCAYAEKQQMGYFSSCHRSNAVKRGSFYLTTAASSPYC